MKQDAQNGIKYLSVNVGQMQAVVKKKQHWNDDKCRCECKELIDKGVCDKGFI